MSNMYILTLIDGTRFSLSEKEYHTFVAEKVLINGLWRNR